MTLKELLTGTLQQLDRGTDAQTMELWRDKLTCYLNDALIDLSGTLQPRRTDTLPLEKGVVNLGLLPRACIKVLALSRNEKRMPFYYGVGTGMLHVPGLEDGKVEITYRYLPAELELDTDQPDLPAWSHSALMAYAVGRERAAGDNISLSAARACFEIYYAAKRRMQRHCGEMDAYRIENIF